MQEIVLISPSFSEIAQAQGHDLVDAVESFKSSVWTQGWGADERVMNDYGDWMVYSIQSDGSLEQVSQMKDIK